MRLRLQIFFPVLVGLFVAAGFMLAAATVGSAVRDTLLTVPGVTRDRAVEAAVAAVVLVGVVVTVTSVIASALIARMVGRPLARLRRIAGRLHGSDSSGTFRTSVGEVQDVADAFDRVTDELRDQHRRESRERSQLSDLIDTVSEGILQIDATGRIDRLNPAGQRLLGLPAGAVGQPVSALIRSVALRDAVERGLAGEVAPAAEVVLDDRRVLASVAPHDHGGVVATFVDLTDLRRLEEVRRDFVANASHELKTPLTSIRGYADTLLTGTVPESEREQFIATISRNADRLQRIVDDLLDLSRLESGRWRPDLEPVDVNELAETTWSAFADRAAEGDIAFSLEAGTDERALADRHALDQILTNLYDNALRYTLRHGRIAVSTRSQASGPDPADGHRLVDLDEIDPEAHWVAIDVADTGAGIPRDAIPRIFERFFRVDPARSRAEGGTGLGLSIVKHLAESMGGGIRAHSVLGKGTTMTVWLRASRGEPSGPAGHVTSA